MGILSGLRGLGRWILGRHKPPKGVTLDELSPPEADGISIRDGVLRDHDRRRKLSIRLYLPAEGGRGKARRAPVVLFSHGLGGSRGAAPYLGRALAAAGYVGVFLQHPGSDREVMAGARSREEALSRLKGLTQDHRQAMERFRDIPFAVDQVIAMAKSGPLAGRIDPERIGIAGHSYGARVVMTAAGQRTGMMGTRFRDRRIRAGIVLSPIAPPGAEQDPAGTYGGIGIPLMHITGTRDGRPLGEGDFDVSSRTLPFRLTDKPEQYLLVLDGATHATFGSDKGDESPGRRHSRLVTAASILFLDAYLRRDPEALRRLREEFPMALDPGDVFEMTRRADEPA